LSRNGRCKVVDFGLARLDEAGRAGEWANPAAESVGTPQFIAPDILSGAAASASSDIYSLGGTLFYLLTGRPPFEAKTTRDLLKMHVSAPVPDLRSVRPDASRGLADAVAKALAKRPAERWASMEQFARVLRVHSIPINSAETSGAIAPPPTPGYFPPGQAPAPSPALPGRSARPASPLQEPLPEAELSQPVRQSSPAGASSGALHAIAAAGGRVVQLYNGLPLWSRLAGSGALVAAVAVILCVAFVKSPSTDVAVNVDEPTSPAPAKSTPVRTPAVVPAAAVQSPAATAQSPAPARIQPHIAAAPGATTAPQPAPRPAILPHVPGELLTYGDFEGRADIGDVKKHGSLDFDPVQHNYTVIGDGFDIYGKSDSFHFVWRKMSGDLTIKADVHLVGTSPAIFRKAALIVRQSLDPGAPFADIVLHGKGTVVVQDRLKGGEQAVQQTTDLTGSTLWLVRRGDQFIGYISSPTGEPQPVAEVTIPMKDPVYVGLGVSARDSRDRSGVKPETAIFSGLEIDPFARVTTLPPPPTR
ncbi:MAG TPA: protein kinase, partial [Tepidisphaeraceae bacterium]